MTCFALGRAGRDCDRAKQQHHVVPQQRIRRAWKSLKAEYNRGGPPPWRLTRALHDERNMLDVCWAHHQLLENSHPQVRVELTDVPIGFWAFVAEYGLVAELPRHLMEAAA